MPTESFDASKAPLGSLRLGSYWSLQVDQSSASINSLTKGSNSAAKVPFASFHLDTALAVRSAESTDCRTAQGLGLYVLSTLLLSIQATAAKLLGQYGF